MSIPIHWHTPNCIFNIPLLHTVAPYSCAIPILYTVTVYRYSIPFLYTPKCGSKLISTPID